MAGRPENASVSRWARLALAAALIGGACRPTATFVVTRPGHLELRDHGRTLTIQPFDGPEQIATAVVDELRRRARAADDRLVRYVRSGAGLIVHGEVVDASYQEHLERRRQPCSRVGGYDDLYREPAYSCYRLVRRGRAHLAIRIVATETDTGRQVLDTTLEDEMVDEAEGAHGSPPLIDGAILLTQLREDLTDRIARLLLPWRERVSVAFSRCGPAQHLCELGVEALRQSQNEDALDAFGAARRQLAADEDTRTRHLAAVWRNLGLARGYSGDFDGAEQALRHALEHEPEDEQIQADLDELRRRRRERRLLFGGDPPPTQKPKTSMVQSAP